MPYIPAERRKEILNKFGGVNGGSIHTEGELNFAITSLCLNYLISKGVSYSSINEVIGVVECAKLELYRRVAGNYEEFKITINGDLPQFLMFYKSEAKKFAALLTCDNENCCRAADAEGYTIEECGENCCGSVDDCGCSE